MYVCLCETKSCFIQFMLYMRKINTKVNLWDNIIKISTKYLNSQCIAEILNLLDVSSPQYYSLCFMDIQGDVNFC